MKGQQPVSPPAHSRNLTHLVQSLLHCLEHPLDRIDFILGKETFAALRTDVGRDVLHEEMWRPFTVICRTLRSDSFNWICVLTMESSCNYISVNRVTFYVKTHKKVETFSLLGSVNWEQGRRERL